MGKIRGIHSSPGVYTRPWFDGNGVNTRDNRKGTRLPGGNISGGGVGPGPTPPKPKYWRFGDKLPIVFS